MSNLFAIKVDDGWGGFEYVLQPFGYVCLILAFVALLALIACIRSTNKSSKFQTKQLVFAAISIALAMVTSYMKLFEAPMGGAVTLCSMLFVTLIGSWYGLRVGLTTALAYGLLQFIIDPYAISIPQVLMDYILGFGALGLSGLFQNRKHGIVKGYLVGIFGRFVFTTLSGVIFFASYAPEGMNPWIYSMGYNGAYIGLEGAITCILLLIPQVSQAFHTVKRYAIES